MCDIDEHAYRAQPAFWILHSGSLKHCADILLEKWKAGPDQPLVRYKLGDSLLGYEHEWSAERVFGGPYLMLAGLAMETLIKGILVFSEPARFSPRNGRVPGEITTHNLPHLFGILNIDVSAAPCNVPEGLAKLQAYVMWAGRYPVATSEATQGVPRCCLATDPQMVEWLYDRLKEKFNEILRARGQIWEAIPRRSSRTDEE